MKKTAIILLLVMIISLCGCSWADNCTAKCANGSFTGIYEGETGVLSFRGIPYAKAPVGELRWKAPESVDPSASVYPAGEFGPSSIQYSWFSEPITTGISEDCLTLNLWTRDLKEQGKAVMVYFHGGSFAWGGSSEDIYNGQYIVSEHSDVIVVTVNYRLGMMGFIDLSGIDGGEDYLDSRELGLLDCVEALKWIKENISAFGGDPNSITIFGESAGGAIVSCLLASDYAGDLFQRVIAQSGSLRLTYDADTYKESHMTNALMTLSGAESMDNLLALSEEELIELNEYPLDDDETCINDLYNLPLRGGRVVKPNAYEAVKAAADKGVDLMIGTTANEQNYWVIEMGSDPLAKLSAEEIETNLHFFEEYYIAPMYEAEVTSCSEEELQKIEKYLSLNDGLDDVWAKAQLLTESVFRQPAIRMAEKHCEGSSGKTYMYYFAKENDTIGFLGACHSCELPYVFHNLTETSVYGTIDEKLADNVCEAWVNFAKTGDPSSDSIHWEEYEQADRLTMVIGNDSSFSVVSDPLKEARILLSWMTDKPVIPNGA